MYSQHLQLDSMSRDLHDKLETEIKATILSLVGSRRGGTRDFLQALDNGLTGKFNFYYGENLWGLNFKKDVDKYPGNKNDKRYYLGHS